MRKPFSPAFSAGLLLIGAFLLCGLETPAQERNVTAVPSIDLKRYSGDWYEIAKLPNKFQKQCVGNTIATFSTKRNDGEMEVLNRCLTRDGKVQQLRGATKSLDAGTNSKMKVSFPKFSSSSYWIVDLEPNYQYAVVASPKRDYLWIYSRTPQMNDAVYQQILRRIEQMGFHPNRLIRTPQEMTTLKGTIVQAQ
jgi:apolipoprotein D and lipocalin family protein